MHPTAQLTRNTAWNVVGQAVPVAAAIFSVPALIARLGQDRFGVLTMVWVIVGYSGLIDLGVGRALTALVAGALSAKRSQEVPALVWTSLAVMFIFGVVGGAGLAGASPWFVHLLGRVPASLRQEMIEALWMLSPAIPIAICSAGLSGILAAAHRFDLINVVQAPLGALSYLGPVVVAALWPNLIAISAFLVIIRLAAALAYLWMCWRVVPEIRGKLLLERSVLPRVLGLGSWMTVTNLVSPLMVNMDRFFIGALISASAVTYYATSQELVNRTTFIPVALTNALFPSFAGAVAADKRLNITLFGRAVDYIFLLALPLSLAIVGFAHDGLALWLGGEFARAAAVPLQILAFGMFINSVARVPFTFVQAVSRPDLTAKAHLAELVFYVAILVGLTRTFGIYGAAIAWSLRVLADAVILFFFSFRLAPSLGPALRRLVRLTLLAGPAFCLLAMPCGRVLHYAMLATAMGGFAYLGWNVLLTCDERRSIGRLAGRLRTMVPCPEATDVGIR
jgi:O-antigen/teichoic acid export membrane protein